MEENKNTQENAVTPKRYPTQLVLTIRVIVGAYVLYSMYEVLSSGDEKSTLMYVAVALIAVIGLIILVWALKMLICGQYEGGKADEWSKMKAEEEANSQEEVIEEAKVEMIEDTQ